MAKLNLNDIGTSFQARQALNENFNLIEQAFENTLSLDGTAPNAMQATLNLNGNDVLNVNNLDIQKLKSGSNEVNILDIQTAAALGQEIQTVAGIESEILTLAHFEDGTVETGGLTSLGFSLPPVASKLTEISNVSDNISAVQIISSDLGGSGFPFDLGSITDPSTEQPSVNESSILNVSENIDSVNTVATNIQFIIDSDIEGSAVDIVSTNINDVVTVATDIANVNSVGSDIANVNTVATNIANVNTTATNIANVNLVAAIDSDVSAVAAIDSDVSAVAANTANVNTTATNISDVVGVSSSIEAVQILGADIGGAGFPFDLGSITEVAPEDPTTGGSRVVSVFNNLDDIQTVATNIANVNSIAAIDSDVSAVAAIDSDVSAVATDIANVNSVGSDIANVNTVATNIANVNTTATNIANVNLVAAIDSDVSAVAAIDNNVTTVATNIANVNTTASDISNINTAATNIQAIIDAPQAATDAESARNKAQLWSQEDEDVEVETGLFSAFHWAQKAASFAQGDAVNINYSNLTSGLFATNAQTAIDELAAEKANLSGGNTFTGTQNITGDVNITGVLDCGSIA